MARNEDNGMVDSYEQSCEDYRNADFTKRLDMYMSMPALRNDFLEIDQKETNTGSFETSVAHIKDLV